MGYVNPLEGTLCETNSSPPKKWWFPMANLLFQGSIFRGGIPFLPRIMVERKITLNESKPILEGDIFFTCMNMGVFWYPAGNESIYHLRKFGKSSTQTCRRGYVSMPSLKRIQRKHLEEVGTFRGYSDVEILEKFFMCSKNCRYFREES